MKKNKIKIKKRTILDAWGWCTGTTQRDGMGREEGGGFILGLFGRLLCQTPLAQEINWVCSRTMF